MKTWDEVVANSISVGKFEEFEIRYCQEEKRFYTQVETDIVSAPSQTALERRVKKILQTEWEEVISVSSHWSPQTPRIVKAVQRDNRSYILDDTGKLKPTDRYNLYTYSKETYMKLLACHTAFKKLEEKEEALKTEWRHILDNAGHPK